MGGKREGKSEVTPEGESTGSHGEVLVALGKHCDECLPGVHRGSTQLEAEEEEGLGIGRVLSWLQGDVEQLGRCSSLVRVCGPQELAPPPENLPRLSEQTQYHSEPSHIS